jgi:hypothetical protein
LQALLVMGSLAVAVGCGAGSGGGSRGGGGGGGGTSSNVQPITIDGGPTPTTLTYVDGLFTTVTVCVPGTSTCQTISHVLVDTGSYGLRVLSQSVDSGGLSLSLTTETVGGNPVGECTQFADNTFLWGPVKTADVKLAGEVASSIPINVAGDPSLTKIPTACSGTNANSLGALGAHGILGVGPFPDDCGTACVQGTTPPSPMYYSCPSSGCTPTFVGATQLVANPVASFATDNNGVIIQLPAIASTGAGTTNGSMIFGIGTQSNNALPATPHIFKINNFASFETTYKGTNYGPDTGSGSTSSYIDSGSNGLFFPDSSIPNCPNPQPGSGFFCPTSQQNLSATQVSSDGTTSNPVSFSILSAQTLFNSNNVAFDDLGGTNTGVFDWGLPFFFGRSVYTGIAGQSTTAPVSTPYWAY